MRKKNREILSFLEERNLEAVILTGQDPWGSEYTSPAWCTREVVSGFSGSAGTVLVTRDGGGVWTDFRYHIQAESELRDSGFRLFKSGLKSVPEWEEWLTKEYPAGTRIGLDPRTVSLSFGRDLERKLEHAGLILVTEGLEELTCRIMSDVKTRETVKTFVRTCRFLDESVAGESSINRMGRFRTWLAQKRLNGFYIGSLDEQGWLLNLRGDDIPYNPLSEGSLYLTPDGGLYGVRKEGMDASLKAVLTSLGIGLVPDFEFFQSLESLLKGRIGLDPDRCSLDAAGRLSISGTIVEEKSPVLLWKAVKNQTEIRGTEAALVQDVRTLCQLEAELVTLSDRDESITEDQVAERLLVLRRSSPEFLGESFATIAASGPRSAMCHYHALPGRGFRLNGQEPFLLDSGSHYSMGTTDLTRTWFFGDNPPPDLIEDYTLVLKAHISLATALFPEGARGYQLDALARRPLWDRGRQYGHGTGHGVGFLLSVHEGPMSLSPRPLDIPLQPGMILSCEPGLYRENHYGIRLENLVVCEEREVTPFGCFLGLRTLSFYPFEEKLIDPELLDRHEKEWLMAYYRKTEELFHAHGLILLMKDRRRILEKKLTG